MDVSRWPIVRHLRWLYLLVRMEHDERTWRRLGGPPCDIDRDILNDVWRGEA